MNTSGDTFRDLVQHHIDAAIEAAKKYINETDEIFRDFESELNGVVEIACKQLDDEEYIERQERNSDEAWFGRRVDALIDERLGK